MTDEPDTTEPGAAPSPRSEEEATNDGRRLEPVGLAMCTALVALAIAALFGARGMHKNASIQPDSPAREVAMAVTGALAGLTGVFGLDEPRRQIASLVGQGDKDDISTSIGTAPKPKPNPAVAPPARQVFTPKRKLRLYAGGDSLSIETAEALSAQAPGTGVITVAEPDGRLNTGLLRPDAFNWFDRAREIEDGFKPNASVIVFGGNDNDGYMTGGPNGASWNAFGSPAWKREYRRRIGLVMDTLTQRPGQVLIWVSAPIAQSAELESQMKVLNAQYRAEAGKRKGSVIFLDTNPIFAPNGVYQEAIVHKGSQVVVREPDGQHLNVQGGVVLADTILDILRRRFDLRSAPTTRPPSTPSG